HATVEDSVDDPERAGVSSEGPRPSGHRQVGRARRSLRDCGCRAAPGAHARAAYALRGAEKIGTRIMNINTYTEKAREAVATAIEIAQQGNNPQLEPEHLLAALIEQREGIVPELLRKMGVDPAALGRSARELVAKFPQAYGGSQPSASPRF